MMSSVSIERGTILALEFVFNRDDHMHYWCLSEGPIIPGKDFYRTTKDLKLFLVPEDLSFEGCRSSTIFEGVVDLKENCIRERLVSELDTIYSNQNNGSLPDGYINSENFAIVIFKSSYIRKIENNTSSNKSV